MLTNVDFLCIFAFFVAANADFTDPASALRAAYDFSFATWALSDKFSNLSCSPFTAAGACEPLGQVVLQNYNPLPRNATRAIFLACVFDTKRPMLVEHFIKHYLQLGIEANNFLIVLNEGGDGDSVAAGFVQSVLARFAIAFSVWRGPFSTGVKLVHLLHVLSTRVRASDWIVWADMDEFHHFPRKLPLFVAELALNGSDAVVGYLVDRLTMSGELVPIKPNVNIGAQFPMQCRITSSLLKGSTQKTILTRGTSMVDGGHHAVPPRQYFDERGCGHLIPAWATQRPRQYREQVYIAHYKWSLGVQAYARARADQFKQFGIDWWVESDRLANFNVSLKKFC